MAARLWRFKSSPWHFDYAQCKHIMLTIIKNFNSTFTTLTSFGKNFKVLAKWLKARKLMAAAIIIAALIIGFAGWNRFRPQPIEAQYELTTVKREAIRQTVNASGKIESQNQVELKFQTSGYLSWVGVKEGNQVNKWQAIASLDQRELQKTLEKTLRDYSKERNDFEEDLQVTYRDKTLTDTIKRLLEKNQWDLDKTVLDAELKDIALKYSTLISPIAGVVTHIDTPIAGVNITPAAAVFTIADPLKLNFVAEIDEIDIGKLMLDQPAELVLDAFPGETFPLTVNWLDFSSSLDSSGATVYLVKFNLLNPAAKLRLGMNGEITINVAEKTDVLTVPSSSVTQLKDSSNVQVVINNRVEDRQVNTGIESEDSIEITSGLNEGETVIVAKKSQ